MHKAVIKLSSAAISVFLLVGCMLSEGHMQDALFVEPEADNVKAVQQALSPFFNGATVQIADDVFTRSSSLVIDKRGMLSRQGQIINSKDVSLPGDGSASGQRFYLKTNRKDCFLLHERSGEQVLLPGLRCLAKSDV